ncbi:MAG: dTDP-4-dehydrorhamnose 3,5-epimerase [Saprospiraceae bacterium]|nr:dTDP-4-dehydrorhamnose 3,5-epimerase [Saprospiraceae bacterium]
MKSIDTPIAGLKIIEPAVWEDERGYFMESWRGSFMKELGYTEPFVQDNESASTYGVLRGLHYQVPPFAQSKLVRVLIGKVLDVVVDIRPASDTYGEHFSIELSGENKRQLLVPRGLAHGYVVLSPEATFVYKCDQYYSRDHEGGLRFDDPRLAIDWKVPSSQLLVSDKDLKQPLLGEHRSGAWT